MAKKQLRAAPAALLFKRICKGMDDVYERKTPPVYDRPLWHGWPEPVFEHCLDRDAADLPDHPGQPVHLCGHGAADPVLLPLSEPQHLHRYFMKEVSEKVMRNMIFEVLHVERKNLRSKAKTDQRMAEELAKIIVDYAKMSV